MVIASRFKTALFCSMLAWLPSAASAQLFVETEALFLGRNNKSSTIRFGDDTSSISFKPPSLDVESGYRLSIGGDFDTFRVDAAFSQVAPWESYSNTPLVPTNGNLTLSDFSSVPIGLPNSMPLLLNQVAGQEFSGIADWRLGLDIPSTQSGFAQESYFRSNFRDAELNFGSAFADRRWRMSGGFRYIQLDERMGLGLTGDLSITGTGTTELTQSTFNDLGAFGGSGDIAHSDQIYYGFNSSTENELMGFQATFAYRIIDKARFKLEGTLRPGIYLNQSRGEVLETVAETSAMNSAYTRHFRGKDNSAAFGGNIGLKAVISLTDYIDLIGGGDVMFLSGVALSGDQHQGIAVSHIGTPSYKVDHSGSMIGYGGTVGLRISW